MYNLSYQKSILLVFMICELLILSIHMFSKGFLLTREVIMQKSRCEDFSTSIPDSNLNTGCWVPKKFNKTVIIIIDALRYDFTQYNISSDGYTEKFYENKMDIFDKLLTKYKKQGILVKFVADPPTTTMQRLKGLTTGSLPTFIDVGHNFASSEIMEDNIIDQMKLSGKKIVVLGDDTWGELFPNRFHRSHLYPSFNVMDLDTVDNGILDHLYLEMEAHDWDVIIAHFLGVDHCGHRFGPNHLQMKRKLEEMNEMIKKVSSLLAEDSLLIVMGDHGMTSNGDHGGDSQAELESALFMFSPRSNVFALLNSQQIAPVYQIDLVPTISFLLGIPVPFSSLGKVIEVLFDKNIKGTVDRYSTHSTNISEILFLNFLQVNRFLKLHQENTNEFSNNDWKKLEEIHLLINSSQSEKNKFIIEYLTLAKLMCVDVWANFNIWNMVLGMISMLCCLILSINIIQATSLLSSSKIMVNFNFRHILYLFLLVNVLYGISNITFNSSLNFICCLFFICFLIMFKISLGFADDYSLFSLIILVLFSFCSFSNSFVIMEDSISSFFCLSLLLFHALKSLIAKFNYLIKVKSSKQFLPISFFDLLFIGGLLGIFICIRLSHLFWKCREEQHWCDSSSLIHLSLSSLPKRFHDVRFVTSMLPIIGLIVILRRWLQSCGNLNGWDIGVFIARTAPVIVSLLIGSYWAILSVPSFAKDISKIVMLLPQLIYLITVIGAIAVFYNPLFVYIMPSHKDPVGSSCDANVIPQLFLRLKQKYEELTLKSRKTPVVYGLATAISAPFIIFLHLFLLILVLISGDGMTAGIFLLVIAAILILGIHSILTWESAVNADSLLQPNWNFTLIWFILSIYGFYCTGHQSTFPSLNWSAAFIGYDGLGSYLIPLILMLLNTFSSHLLFAISLPLLLIAPLSAGFLWPSLRLNKLNCEEMTRGEFLLVERSERSREAFRSLSLMYLKFHAFKVLCTTAAAFVLRRHLMVWKIFAPHFIFEAVGFIITCVGIIIGLTFVFRIISVLGKWSEKLVK